MTLSNSSKACPKVHRARAVSLLLPLLLSCTEILAWDAQLHRSIIEGAIELSPAAATRIPAEYLETVLSAAEGDRYSEEARDPFGEAESALKALLLTSRDPWSRNRAILMARYLHFVSHASIAMTERGVVQAQDIFSGREIVVFRTRRDLAAGLKETLRAVAAGAHWASDPLSSMNQRFRDAINLTADALLRIPGTSETTARPGRALFIFDQIDSGIDGYSERYRYAWWVSVDPSLVRFKGTSAAIPTPHPTARPLKTGMSPRELREAGKTSRFKRLYDTPGLTIVEFQTRDGETSTEARILLFNNSAECLRPVSIKAGSWTHDTENALPPYSLLNLEVTIPGGLSGDGISVAASGRAVPCHQISTGDAIALETYRIIPATATKGPNYSSGQTREFRVPEASPPPKGNATAKRPS